MTFDAAVIGAGPAGAVAARELARSGLRVLLVDKAQFPRPKVCGCSLNGSAIATLRRLGLGDVLANAVPLRNVRIGAGRRSAVVKLSTGAALSREAFDVALIRAAEHAGVEFRPGTAAKFTEPDGLQLGTETLNPRVTVLATGLAGSDATIEPGARIGAGVAVAAEAVPAFYDSGTIFMATGRGGYVGLVRLEDGRLDVAAAFDVAFVKAAGGLGPAAEAILSEVGWPVAPGLAERPWKGTPALTRRANHLAGARWFAVGDAAGYVEPFTGEGMAWAVASGAAVGPLAARAARHWEPALVSEWEATHRRVIARRQGVCRAVSRVLRWPALTTAAVRALAVLPALARPVVSALNRPSALSPHGPTA